MIIDCHGHYTKPSQGVADYRGNNEKLSAAEKAQIFEGNARKVFSRLKL